MGYVQNPYRTARVSQLAGSGSGPVQPAPLRGVGTYDRCRPMSRRPRGVRAAGCRAFGAGGSGVAVLAVGARAVSRASSPDLERAATTAALPTRMTTRARIWNQGGLPTDRA